MKTIECTRGATEQQVAGVNYAFQRDKYGRFVAQVHNEEHAKCFISVDHYREVPEHPEPEMADEPTETVPPVAGDGENGTTEHEGNNEPAPNGSTSVAPTGLSAAAAQTQDGSGETPTGETGSDKSENAPETTTASDAPANSKPAAKKQTAAKPRARRSTAKGKTTARKPSSKAAPKTGAKTTTTKPATKTDGK